MSRLTFSGPRGSDVGETIRCPAARLEISRTVSDSAIARPLDSYGLLLSEPNVAASDVPEISWLRDLTGHERLAIWEALPSLVAICPKLLETFRCAMGAWVGAPDLSAARRFFADVAGGREARNGVGHAFFVVKTTAGPNFLWLAFENRYLPKKRYYNDDWGLTGAEWTGRDLETLQKIAREKGLTVPAENDASRVGDGAFLSHKIFNSEESALT